jgi:aminoglycoside phosphotransferase (APT) family kinase protein
MRRGAARMSETVYDVIPEERRAAAQAAIAAGFGVARATSILPITQGGSGALIYRVEVDDRPYLLRLERRRDGYDDGGRGYICMRTAAEAGIAPPLIAADSAGGFAIMEFRPAKSLFNYPTGREGLMRDLGALVARLQATATFPEVGDYRAILTGMFDSLIGSGRFKSGLLDAHRAGLARLTEAFSWDATKTVSSHNDLNPGNIIFDGERLWLVDWELAFRNDAFVDIANLANYLAPTDELRDALLRSWLGREPDRFVRARLVLARQLVRIGYACLTLIVTAGVPRVEPDGDLSAPSLAEFHQMLVRGQLRMGTPENMYLYGKVYLNEFLANLSKPEFEQALTVARAG